MYEWGQKIWVLWWEFKRIRSTSLVSFHSYISRRERGREREQKIVINGYYGHSILHVLLQTLPTNMFLLNYIKCRRSYNEGKYVLFYNTRTVCYRLKSQIYISNFIYFKNKPYFCEQLLDFLSLITWYINVRAYSKNKLQIWKDLATWWHYQKT